MKKLIPLVLGATLMVNTIACSSPKDTTANNSNNPSNTTNTKLVNTKNPQAIVAANTDFETKLQQEISTGKNRENDKFVLKVRSNNPVLKDSTINGHLENVIKAAKGKKAKLNLVFDDISLKNGDRLPIDATLVNTKIESKTKGKFLQNAGIILGGAAAGSFLGNKTNFKHGGLAGGTAAAAYVLSSPGGEVVLKKGTEVKLKLKTPLDAS
ncbi:hypothetical protein NIES4101_45400 [Calothrix sp. NIES-4101]|nr:hypothetical protein NIES4101_45400 [Calothrix sp. NIES-4101]